MWRHLATPLVVDLFKVLAEGELHAGRGARK